jgi:SAM-dependent methyltransferase
MSKQAEREYPLKVDCEHLYRKPFIFPREMREFALALDLLQGLMPRGSVLDLGCGSGWTSLFLARAGYDVVGVDIAERMIEIARDRARSEESTAEFVVQDIEQLDLDKRDFHAVLLFDALHHCPGYREVLSRALQHLRTGGHLVIMEPSWLHHFSPAARAFSRQYGVTELGFTRWGLGRALQRAGFRRLTHYYDSGHAFRGLGGLVWTGIQITLCYLVGYPQNKQIIVAQK